MDTKNPGRGRGFHGLRNAHASIPDGRRSAYASSPQSRRRELVVGRRGATELRCRGFLCIHAQGDVATCQQVIQGFHGVARNLVLVVEGQMPFTYTPQGATTVIVVSQGDHPGVLVHKEVTLGVDVTLTLLHVTLYFPGTVQFEAGVLGIDVTGLEHISVLQTRLGQLAGVVRQKDLFLADQFPVIAVRSATVHGEVVSGTHAVGSGTRTIIGYLRGATYTTLTSVVYPGHTRLFQLIQSVMHQQYVTRQTGRGVHPLFEEQQGVGHAGRINVRHQVRIADFLFHLDQGEGAVGLRHGLDIPAMHVQAVAGHVVPDHFRTGFRNREHERRIWLDVLHAVASIDQLGLPGSTLDLVIYALREAHGTVGLVHRHAEGFRVALEQRNLARGQVVAILLVVLRSDDELRLLILERVFQEVVGKTLTGIGRQATSPLRNGACGVTGLLRTDRRQGVTQLIDFCLGQALCCYGTGHQAQGQTTGTDKYFLHLHVVCLQNLLRSLRRS